MFNSSILGFKKGPALNKSKTEKIDDYWTLIGIPEDIPKKTAINNVKNFLTKICSIEVPSSLMCNANCVYCYIREKWLKNTIVTIDEIKKIVELSYKEVFKFNKDKNSFNITAWGAEPFCNVDTLEYILNFCIENNCTTNLSTNGTIVNNRIKELLIKFYRHCKENNIKYSTIQISLDGPKHIQDKYRPLYNNESNFNKVEKFIEMMNSIALELDIKEKLYTFCGTLYLNETCIKDYKDSIEFYIDLFKKNHYDSNIIPIRIENSKNFTKKDADLFYKLIEESTNLLIKKSEEDNIGYIDHYTTKLFLETSRIDGCTRCSAMNTQLGIDIDGSIYMCHGPITISKIKPFHCFGNIFDGIIDYRKFISVLDRVYYDVSFRAICKTCELSISCPGSICTSCSPIGDSNNFEPINYNIHICDVYQKCYPLWKKLYENFCKF